MVENSLTRESLCRKLAKYKEQYYRAMAEYCLLNKGIEFPSPEQIKEKASELKKITFQKPLITKTIQKPKYLCLSIKYAWSKLIVRENDYYNHLAIYNLFQLGVENPSAAQIREEIRSLSHANPKKSFFLTRRLTRREIQCIYLASSGEGLKNTARALNIAIDSVSKFRSSIFRKLNCNTLSQVIFIATQIGYLPLQKDKEVVSG